ncbi:sugar kinase [Arachidicoccus ginsenosidimutans]|uniref:ROK family protein n=1 Tax=Arachidicoccus sp. BS20 TaxID=1850526 RepID=UPI0007F0E54A|nr:ROK family protein [Arachidicoccus sp. BS20]ANI90147.1 sugar kinase [Arachidicoccus sp. BS20]
MSPKNISYRKSILKELLSHQTLACADISASIGKSVVLTTRVLNEMITHGIVEEKGLAPSSGGRRPATYSIKPDAVYLVSVAMDQFVTRIALLDAGLNPVIPETKIELPLANNEHALETLTNTISSVIKKSGIAPNKILGIGIAMPGFIDAKKGANYTFLGHNTAAFIKTQTGLPVFIENDSSAIALAEYKFGIAKGEKNAMIINISWGVGLGMIIDNKLFRGDNGFAGEFSHIPLFINGKLCSCGKTGCLETETSLGFMLEQAIEKINHGRASVLKKMLTDAKDHEQKYQDFIKAANIGDSLVVEIISDAGYNIGRGIAILIHLLNPGKIVISGRCAAAGKIWLAPIQRAINEFCIPHLVSNTKVEVSTLNHKAEIIGAAALLIENIQHSTFDRNEATSNNNSRQAVTHA